MARVRSILSVVVSVLMIGLGLGCIWYSWHVLDWLNRTEAQTGQQTAGEYALLEELHFTGYDFSVQTAETASIVMYDKAELRARPGRQFVVVTAEITNTGQSPITFTWASAVQLIDGDGLPLDHDVSASQAFADQARAAGLVIYDYGQAVIVDPGRHKVIALLFDVPDGRFDRRTWKVRLRGRDIRISLVPSPPDPNATIYDVF